MAAVGKSCEMLGAGEKVLEGLDTPGGGVAASQEIYDKVKSISILVIP